MLDGFSYLRFKKDYIAARKPLPQVLFLQLILWERLSSRDLIDLDGNRVKFF